MYTLKYSLNMTSPSLLVSVPPSPGNSQTLNEATADLDNVQSMAHSDL